MIDLEALSANIQRQRFAGMPFVRLTFDQADELVNLALTAHRSSTEQRQTAEAEL